MYNPPAPSGQADGDVVEYIQLKNCTTSGVLFETEAGPWRIDGGVSYTFRAGFTLPANETLWLVSFDPADTVLLNLFCTTYGLNAAQEMIMEPCNGHLSNEGERVALERTQESDALLKPHDISWVIVDELFYFDQSPWPEGADGTEFPLERTGQSAWSVDWAADSDSDGLSDNWENQFFNSLDELADDDGDNDGFSNLHEQISGTDPTNSQSYFIGEDIVAPSIQWNAVTGRRYSVYWTDDLSQPFTRMAFGLSTNAYTDSTHTTNGCNYYYITVEME